MYLHNVQHSDVPRLKPREALIVPSSTRLGLFSSSRRRRKKNPQFKAENQNYPDFAYAFKEERNKEKTYDEASGAGQRTENERFLS